MAAVTERLTDEECYLLAILIDPSGIDQAELCWFDPETQDAWRAWSFQWKWFRCTDTLQIDQAARAVGKSLSIKLRAFAFPFVHPGQEMVITAPELVHLNPIIGLIERQFEDTRLGREMVVRGRSGVTHRPFQMNLNNGSRIIGRIPQTTGRGVKGVHPIWLEQDECFPVGTLVLLERGLVPIEEVAIGDRALTHQGRWRLVTKVFDRGERPAVSVRGQGHPGLVVTPSHPFLAQRARRWRRGTSSGWEWIEAADLVGHYWASPRAVPALSVPPIPEAVTNKKRPVDPLDPELLYLLGFYIAEGSTSSAIAAGPISRATWSVTPSEAEEIALRFKRLGIAAAINPIQGSDECMNVVVSHSTLARWLAANCGSGARNKAIPLWVFGLADDQRQLVLEGLVRGDGFYDPDPRYSPGRWKVSTSSKALAVSLRLLAQAQGYSVSVYWAPPRDTTIRGRRVRSHGWYQVVGNPLGQGIDVDHLRLTKVRSVVSVASRRMYDLEVDEDHSFIADGVIVHNSQDYPKDGWTELTETLQMGKPGAVWRAHGVTRGVQDEFYDHTQDTPDNPWTVHRITAMARPNWSDEERQKKIREYGGSRDAPDYRRNVLGLHGDATNPLFVMHRFMRVCDTVEGSTYNATEYEHFNVKAEMLEDRAGYAIEDQIRGILQMLDFSSAHKNYGGGGVVWVGMDVGFTADPSEILVFVEYEPTMKEAKADEAAKRAVPEGGLTRLRLLTRITLQRIGAPLQVEVIKHVCDHYRPRAFALDKTGNGLPLFQAVQASALSMARTIKGYNFSEKVIVDIDGTITVGEGEDILKEAAIKSNVLEYSTDALRGLVDQGRLMLPFESELIREFNGQSFTYSKSPIDQYGRRRRIFSQGHFHALDAARMAAMAHAQHAIEEFIEAQKQDNSEPVYDYFLAAGV